MQDLYFDLPALIVIEFVWFLSGYDSSARGYFHMALGPRNFLVPLFGTSEVRDCDKHGPVNEIDERWLGTVCIHGY